MGVRGTFFEDGSFWSSIVWVVDDQIWQRNAHRVLYRCFSEDLGQRRVAYNCYDVRMQQEAAFGDARPKPVVFIG